jgi:hypothetical protein
MSRTLNPAGNGDGSVMTSRGRSGAHLRRACQKDFTVSSLAMQL